MDAMSGLYSRDSFHRFGDDLCEEVLSYLTFEDKFRFECVAKQWKRSLFRKQYDLVVKQNQLFESNIRIKRIETFEAILKKCTEINSIYFIFTYFAKDEQMLESIVNYCNN